MSVALNGCQRPSDGDRGRLELESASLAWRDSHLAARAGLDLELSKAAREALRSGVELTITVDLRFTRRYRWFARELYTDHYHWRIAYQPLSRHYRLTSPLDDQVVNLPHLSQVSEELTTPRWYPTRTQSKTLGSDRYQLQTRARLNRLQLPGPLQLPALFSRQWLLTTSWQPIPVPSP